MLKYPGNAKADMTNQHADGANFRQSKIRPRHTRSVRPSSLITFPSCGIGANIYREIYLDQFMECRSCLSLTYRA